MEDKLPNQLTVVLNDQLKDLLVLAKQKRPLASVNKLMREAAIRGFLAEVGK